MTADAALLDRLVPHGVRVGDDIAEEARRWLEAHGLPGSRDEAWLYTPVEAIVARLRASVPASASAVAPDVVDRLAGHHDGPRLVFVNGVHDPSLSDASVRASGLWYGPLSEVASTDPIRSHLREPFADGFDALGRMAAADAAVVVVDPGTTVEGVVHIVHLAAPGRRPVTAHPHTLIALGERSRLHVVETFAGLPGDVVTNASTVIELDAEASLTHHRIQVEADSAIHIGRTRVSQAADSSYRGTSIMYGARIARHAIDVALSGRGARADLDGLYQPTGDQQHDTAVCVDHAADHCTSTQLFKGVVDGWARGAFSGRIIVRADTRGNDARQTNKNLLLTKSARADTRPWLEIFADDVSCTHGATVGRLDDEALFYLRSRGIPEQEARAMLTDAFVAEIVDRVGPASLRRHLTGIEHAPNADETEEPS